MIHHLYDNHQSGNPPVQHFTSKKLQHNRELLVYYPDLMSHEIIIFKYLTSHNQSGCFLVQEVM